MSNSSCKTNRNLTGTFTLQERFFKAGIANALAQPLGVTAQKPKAIARAITGGQFYFELQCAVTVISIRASPTNFATPTVVRAGRGSGNVSI